MFGSGDAMIELGFAVFVDLWGFAYARIICLLCSGLLLYFRSCSIRAGCSPGQYLA